MGQNKNKTALTTIGIDHSTNRQIDTIYYYYQGEKTYLTPSTNKMLVKIANNANRNRLSNLIQTDSNVEISTNIITDTLNSFIILETKINKNIDSLTLSKYRESPDVVSAYPMLRYGNGSVLNGVLDKFIVKLKPSTTLFQLQNLLTNNNCYINSVYLDSTLFFITTNETSTTSALQMANMFYETSLFEFSEPDFLIDNSFQSNDTYFNDQWGLKNTGQYGGTAGIDIKVEQAWTITEGSSNIKIAVVDDGVDRNNIDLSPNLIEGINVLDFLNTNYVYASMEQGVPKYNDDNHGTACAGIIVARKNNEGISGVAPNCKVMPINIGSFKEPHKTVTTSSLAIGILFSYLFGADVISNSWRTAPF